MSRLRLVVICIKVYVLFIQHMYVHLCRLWVSAYYAVATECPWLPSKAAIYRVLPDFVTSNPNVLRMYVHSQK